MPKQHDHEYSTLIEQERLILDATELVHELMEKEDLSQNDLAERLGKSKGFVSQVLNGKRNMTLRTLADLLRVAGYRARFEAAKLSEPVTPSRAPQPVVIDEFHGFKGDSWHTARDRARCRHIENGKDNALYAWFHSEMPRSQATNRGPRLYWDLAPPQRGSNRHQSKQEDPVTGVFELVS